MERFKNIVKKYYQSRIINTFVIMLIGTFILGMFFNNEIRYFICYFSEETTSVYKASEKINDYGYAKIRVDFIDDSYYFFGEDEDHIKYYVSYTIDEEGYVMFIEIPNRNSEPYIDDNKQTLIVKKADNYNEEENLLDMIAEEWAEELEYEKENVASWFMPYTVEIAPSFNTNLIGIIILGLFELLCIIYLMINIVKLIKTNTKIMIKGFDDLKIDELANDFSSPHYDKGIILGKKYLYINKGKLEKRFIPIKDIAWYYQYIVKNTYNGVPAGKNYFFFIIIDGNKKAIQIPIKKKEVLEFEKTMVNKNPQILCGFDDEYMKIWLTTLNKTEFYKKINFKGMDK